jgi:hypothetical protein
VATADLTIGSSAQTRFAGLALNLVLGDIGKRLSRGSSFCFTVTLLLALDVFAAEGVVSLTVTSEPVARLPLLDYGSYDDCLVPRSFAQAMAPDAPSSTIEAGVIGSTAGGLIINPVTGGRLRLRFLKSTLIWDVAGTPLRLSDIRAGELLNVWIRGCQVPHGASDAYASVVITCHSIRCESNE